MKQFRVQHNEEEIQAKKYMYELINIDTEEEQTSLMLTEEEAKIWNRQYRSMNERYRYVKKERAEE